MNDLIRRSDLIEMLTNENEREYTKEAVLQFVQATPTAYNVDKVAKELRETNKNLCDHIICCKEKCCGICVVNNFLREQIEIVRKGGVK